MRKPEQFDSLDKILQPLTTLKCALPVVPGVLSTLSRRKLTSPFFHLHILVISSPPTHHICKRRCEPLSEVTQSSVRDCVLYLDIQVYMKFTWQRQHPHFSDSVDNIVGTLLFLGKPSLFTAIMISVPSLIKYVLP